MDLFLKEIGKYKIESHIGRGAFGVVYKCKNKETNEIVAVKTLRKITKTSQKLIKSEIDVLQSIHCENVVKMIESFTDKLPYDSKDYQFLVMEYCESNLLDYVFHKKNHVLEETEAIEIFLQILNGFQSIHEKGIMHRDLKLENVLIKDGIVKIADFGLAKKFETSNSNEQLAKSFCGTKAYLAPEVLMGNLYDYKVDIWSLGVLLFVMLFFKFPFGSRQDNPLELLKRIKACCEDHPFDVDLFIKQNFKKKAESIEGQILSKMQSIKHEQLLQQNLSENPKEEEEEKQYQISEEMKDLFKKIFVIKPEDRIGFQELLQHPALHRVENIQDKIDFYGNKFPTLFKYQSQLLIEHSNENHQEGNDNMNDSNCSHEEKQKEERKKEITTGCMSSIMMVRSSTIRFNMKNSSQFRQHIMIYNHLICRYQMLLIAYQQVQQGWLIELLGQKEYTILKYFLLKSTIYYLQNLQIYLDEADNTFDLKEWPTFVNCKAFKNIKSQISQDLKKWLPEYHLLSQEVQEYEYDSQDIKKGVQEQIPTNVDFEVYINSMPNELKLPFRAVVLTIFSKVYEYASKSFAKQEELEIQMLKLKDTQSIKQSSPLPSPLQKKTINNNSPHQKNKSQQFFSPVGQIQSPLQQNKSSNFIKKNSMNNSKNSNNNSHNTNNTSLLLNTSTAANTTMGLSSYQNQQLNSPSGKAQSIPTTYNQKLIAIKIQCEEQFGLKSIRMALLLICCGVINRIFEVPSCIIRIREFQPQEINYNAQNQQETFKFEELVEWFYQVPKEKAYKQIELIVKSYFQQISSQLCSNSSSSQNSNSTSNVGNTNLNNNHNNNQSNEDTQQNQQKHTHVNAQNHQQHHHQGQNNKQQNTHKKSNAHHQQNILQKVIKPA